MDFIAITVLGNRNSGKSKTWNKLFGRRVKTGIEVRRLYFNRKEYVKVFLVSGSPEERETYVGGIIGRKRPQIILCSIQYREDAFQTIQFFIDNNYSIFCHWLNPGFHDDSNVPVFDSLGIINCLLSLNATVGIRNGKKNPSKRVREMRGYIYGWAKTRNLILSD